MRNRNRQVRNDLGGPVDLTEVAMPRFMSPLRPRYMRSPSDVPKEGLQVQSITPTQNASEATSNEPQEQPEYPETICVSEGTFRQIRDDSLVLLSQGISHRLIRSEEGPFQIFILPEQRRPVPDFHPARTRGSRSTAARPLPQGKSAQGRESSPSAKFQLAAPMGSARPDDRHTY